MKILGMIFLLALAGAHTNALANCKDCDHKKAEHGESECDCNKGKKHKHGKEKAAKDAKANAEAPKAAEEAPHH